MSLKQGVFLLSLCLLVIFAACRRNQPSLVDRNEAPDTQLWYSPPDSTEYEYLVHMFWRGTDNDGTVEEYIWTIRDTLVLNEQLWNPAQRLADLRSGRRTVRTDSIFSFTAFRDVGGVGVKKNRQAFHIASIDDNGVIDPSPAAVEFVATIDKLPEIRFSVRYLDDNLNLVSRKPYSNRAVLGLAPEDTIGMYRPFGLSYHGLTTNGLVRGYRWRPLSTTVVLDSADVWTDDLGDTVRTFANSGNQVIPSSTFRFAAQCIDDAQAESSIDAGQFRSGVALVVVNFDPDTRVTEVWNSYTKDDVLYTRSIDFADGVPDTVSYRSWLFLRYQGWDDKDDKKTCSPSNRDRCIDFQISYERVSSRVAGSLARSGWLPRDGFHDTDSLSATDSNTVNIGSLEYDFSVRAVDENERADGTPAMVHIIGNFDPTLDIYKLADQDGVPLNIGTVDTLTWKWSDAWKDSLDIASLQYLKIFKWRLQATGHDHPLDPDGSGVKSWRYFIYTDYGTPAQKFQPLARAGETWVAGATLDRLNDTFQLTFRWSALDPSSEDAAFNDALSRDYMNKDLTVVMRGRDTAVNEASFDQIVFLNGEKKLINSFPAASFGRYTPEVQFTFHFRMVR